MISWGGGVAFAMPGLVKKDHMYSRLSNPNRDGFEKCLASLEGGKRALGARLCGSAWYPIYFASGLCVWSFCAFSGCDLVVLSLTLSL